MKLNEKLENKNIIYNISKKKKKILMFNNYYTITHELF
jgi:hypothetical protein